MSLASKRVRFPRRPVGRVRHSLIALALVVATIPGLSSRPANAQKLWDGGGGNSFWDVAANWAGDTLPGALDDVVNNTGATIDHRSGTDTVNSLDTNGQLLLSGGQLTISSLLSFSAGGSLRMGGGTLRSATIQNASLVNFDNNGNNTFDGVTLAAGGTLSILSNTSGSGFLRVRNGLTYANGTNFVIGGNSATSQLIFDGNNGSTVTFDNANVTMGGPTGGSGSIGFGTQNNGTGASNLTLVLGSGLNVQGRTANFGETFNGVTNSTLQVNTNLVSDEGGTWTLTADNLVVGAGAVLEASGTANSVLTFTSNLNSAGTIRAQGGRTVNINGTVTALGTVQANGAGSVVNLNSNVNTSQLGGLTVSGGGLVNLTGIVTNTGNTFDVQNVVGAGGANGSLVLNSGTITGGTLNNSNLLRFVNNGSNLFDGVTVSGGLNILDSANSSGFLRVRNGLTYANGTNFAIGGNNATSQLVFDINNGGTATFDNANVTMGGAASGSGSIGFGTQNNGTGASNITLVLGSGLNVQGRTANFGETFNGVTNSTLQVNANLVSDEGGTWTLTADNLVIGAGATLEASGLANSVMTLNGALNNSGTIRAQGGRTVNVNTTATQLGTVQANGAGSVVNLNANFDTNQFNAMTVSGDGTINLLGNITNTGNTFDVQSVVGPGSANGSLVLSGSTLTGGTLTNANLLRYTNNGNNIFDGVTVDGLTILDGNSGTGFLRIRNGLSHPNGSNFVIGGNGANSQLVFDINNGNSFTLDNANVTLGGPTSATGNLGFGTQNNGTGASNITLVLGSGLNVQGRTATFGETFNAVTNSTLQADTNLISDEGGTWTFNGDNLLINAGRTVGAGGVANSVLTINDTTTINNGTIEALNGRTVNVGGNLSTVGTLHADGAGSVVNLTGTATITNADTINSTNGGFTQLSGGTLTGSLTAANAAGLRFTNNGTNIFDGVTLGAGSTVTIRDNNDISGFLRIRNTLITNGTNFVIGGNGANSQLVFDINNGGSFTFDNANLTMGGPASGTGNLGFGTQNDGTAASNITLVLGSGLNIQGRTATFGETFNSVTNSTLQVNTNLISDEGGIWTFNGDNLLINAGRTVGVAGLANSVVNINDATTVNNGTIEALNGRTVNVGGNLSTFGTLHADGAGSVVNLTGTAAITNADTINATNGGFVQLNSGTLTGSLTAANAAGLRFENNGSNIFDGVTLGAGSTLTIRDNIDASGFLRVRNAFTFPSGTNFVLGGNGATGQLVFDGNNGSTVTFDNANVTMGGPATGTGNIGFGTQNDGTAASNLTLVLGSGLNIQGRNATFGETFNSVTNSTLQVNTDLISNEGGTWTLTADNLVVGAGHTVEASGLANSVVTFSGGAGTTTNNGTIRAAAGTTTVNVAVPNFTNTGTLEATGGGHVTVTSLAANTPMTNSGNINVGAGSQMFVGNGNGGNGINQTAGSTTVDGTLTLQGTVANPSPLTMSGGTLGGSGTITGGAVNVTGGTVNPGAANGGGTLTVAGNTTLGAGATFLSQIGGSATGNFDVLSVTGAGNSIALGGTLNIDLINGFSPANGQTFTLLTAVGGLTGSFASVNLLDPGFTFTTNIVGNDFRVTFNQAGPVAVQWTGLAGDGLWATGGNWTSNPSTPQPADDVVNTTGQAISHTTGTDTVNSLAINGVLTVSGGSTLNVTNGMLFNAGGSLVLNNGTFGNGTLSDPLAVSFSNSSGNVLSNVTLGGGIGLGVADGASQNQDVRIANGITFTNGAAFNVGTGTSSTGVLAFDGSQTFNNATVNLGSASGTGFLEAGAGATAKTLTLGASLIVQGTGVVGGAMLGSNDVSLVNNGTVSANISNRNLTVQATGTGTLTNNGIMQANANNATLTVNGGAGGLSNSGTIRAISGGTANIQGTVTTLGTVIADGPTSIVNLNTALNTNQLGGLTVANGGTANILNNTLTNTGNTFDVQNVVGAGGANGAFFLSNSTLTGGTLNHPELLSFTNNNSNILENVTLGGTTLNASNGSNFGRVRLRGTALPNAATLNVGNATVGGGIGFDIADGGTQTLTNATINFGSSPGTGQLYFGQTPTGGTQQNTTLALGSGLTLSGRNASIGEAVFGVTNSTVSNAATLTSNGAGTWSITADNIVNSASGVIESTAAGSAFTLSGPLSNAGIIRANTSASASVNMTGTSVSNSGTLEATGGGRLFAQSLSAGTQLANTGTINIGTGSQMNVGNNANTGINQTAGTTTVNGTMTIQGAGSTFTLAGGTLGGSGTVTGGLVNNTGGTVSPGNGTGTLSFGAGYSQGAGGSLLMEIGGTAGGQFDVLAVTGAITLGGTLNLDLINGFAPSAGQTFTLLTSTTGVTGSFASINLLDPGFTVTPNIVGNDFRITFNQAGPVAVQWTGNAGDGLWATANNWSSTPSLPGVNDDVVNSTGQSINHATGTDTVRSLTVNGPLTISGNSTLNVANNLDFTAGGSATLNDGTLGNATVSDPSLLNFTNNTGNVLSSVVLANTTLNVSNGATFGQVRLRNTSLPNGIAVNIGTSATGGILDIDMANSATTTLDNLTMNFGTSGSNGNLSFGLTPAGAAQQDTTLALGAGLTLNGRNASIGENNFGVTNSTVSNSANLTSDENGTWTVVADNIVNNAGGIMQAGTGSTLTVNAHTGLVNSGLIRALNGGTANIQGAVTTLGTVTADGATSVVNLSAPLNTNQLGGLSVANGGTANILNTTLTNTSNTFDVQSVVGAGGVNGSLVLSNSTLTGGTLNNPDLLRFTNSNTNILENVTLGGTTLNASNGSNFGRVRLRGTALPNAATLNVGNASVGGSVAFDIADGGTQNLTNAAINFGTGGTGTVAFGLTPTDTAQQNTTLALGTGLTLTGRNASIGEAIFSVTNSTVSNAATLTSNGGGNWNITADNVTNGASGIIEATAANSSFTVSGPLTNAGIVRANSSNTATVSLVGTSVSNSGTLEATGGGHVNVTNLAASTPLANTGTINVGAGSQMNVGNGNGGNGINQTTGSTTVNGTMTLTGAGSEFTLAGGTLGGSGTVTGGLVNNTGGTVSPGNGTGTLSFGAGYSQGAGGSLLMEIGGTAGGQFDVLAVTGAITLGGTLNLDLVNSFLPADGTTLTLLTSTTGVTGSFATISLLDPGYTVTPNIVGNDFRITFNQAGPVAVQWTGNAGDGLWATANNWTTTPALPQPSDDVVNSTGQPINHATGTDTVNSLTINGALTVSGGSTLNVANNLAFNAGGSATLSNGTLGNATVTDPTLLFFSNSTGNVLSNVTLGGTTFNVSSGGNLGQVRLRNTGLPNGTTVNIGTGTVGGTLGFDIANGTTQNLTNTTFNFGTGAGTGQLAFGQTPTNGTQQNTTLALGSGLTLNGRNASIGEVVFGVTNSTVSNGTTLTSDEGGHWNITADNVVNSSSAVIEATAANSSFTVNGALSNAGTIRATSSNSASVTLAGGAITNLASGLIIAQGGGSISHTTAETFSSAGTVTVGVGSQLTVGSGGISQTAGTTTVDGILALQSGGAYNLSGGILKGTGSVTGGDIINTGGILAPGDSPGTFSLTGNYSQSGAGTLLIEIGGPNTADFDHLNVTGGITLGGVLNVSVIAGFSPTDGETFDFLSATGGITGAFSQINLFGFPGTVTYSQTSTTGTLTYVSGGAAAPEPGALALVLLGGVCGFIVRRRAA